MRSEQAEIREALDAGLAAARLLQQARDALRSAGDWATYDTFLGGGRMGDAMQYDRMDKAQVLLHQARQALPRRRDGCRCAACAGGSAPGPRSWPRGSRDSSWGGSGCSPAARLTLAGPRGRKAAAHRAYGGHAARMARTLSLRAAERR